MEYRLARKSAIYIGAACCCALMLEAARQARADWLRRNPTESGVEEAIRLDPTNAYAYSLRAEFLERSGRDSEPAWKKAAEYDPRNAEILIQNSLARERKGDQCGCEQGLLQAAASNHTWLPRWTLTSYYLRHGNTREAYRWARLAAERSAGDLRPLFQALRDSGASPEFIATAIVPANRATLLAYLWYLIGRDGRAGVEITATRLADLIPDHPPGWPGLDIGPAGGLLHRTFPTEGGERAALLSAVNRLLEGDPALPAVDLWNHLVERRVISSEPWKPDRAIVNGSFRFPLLGGGLDWMAGKGDGFSVDAANPEGFAEVDLTGTQGDASDLLAQTVCAPRGRSYHFQFESSTEQVPAATGVSWEFRDRATGAPIAGAAITGSESWMASGCDIPAAAADRVFRLVLTYRRLPGTVRSEGNVRVRNVRLESRP